MKELPTNNAGIAANSVQSPMNRSNRHMVLSLAAIVLAGLAAAAPGAASAQYTFTIIDAPGATGTDLIGFTSQTIVGDFNDADGNLHGWLLSKDLFTQFDAPGSWWTSVSAINHRGQFGGLSAMIPRIRRDATASL